MQLVDPPHDGEVGIPGVAGNRRCHDQAVTRVISPVTVGQSHRAPSCTGSLALHESLRLAEWRRSVNAVMVTFARVAQVGASSLTSSRSRAAPTSPGGK